MEKQTTKASTPTLREITPAEIAFVMDTAPTLGQLAFATMLQKCGYTQEYIAKECNVSQGAVSRWATCRRKPNPENLISLGKLLNVSPVTLKMILLTY